MEAPLGWVDVCLHDFCLTAQFVISPLTDIPGQQVTWTARDNLAHTHTVEVEQAEDLSKQGHSTGGEQLCGENAEGAYWRCWTYPAIDRGADCWIWKVHPNA